MLFEDVEVWRRYLNRCGHLITSVWYDIHVGTPVKIPEGSPAFLKEVALGVTRKRIDVILLLDNCYYVVEIKPECSMIALGQALVYEQLFKQEHPECSPVKAMIICDRLDPDVPRIAELMTILVECNYFEEPIEQLRADKITS